MTRDESFTGRSALVTGAGRGIGRAIALALAADGVRVALLARSEPELDEVAEAARALGAEALVLPTDLSDREATASAVEKAQVEFGGVDILINNAGVVWPLEATAGVAPSEWRTNLEINVMGPVSLTIAVLPGMLERQWGRIVNITARIAANPGRMIGGNAYATSKSALEAHTLNLAAELGGTGVTVNAYRPGSVDTSIQEWIRGQPAEKVGDAVHDQFAQMHAEGAFITPEKSAQALLDRLKRRADGVIWDVDEN